MDFIFGIIVFIVVTVLSMANKAQQERKIRERQQRGKSEPDDLPAATRQILFGEDTTRTATPKGASTPRTATPKADRERIEEMLLETLLGKEVTQEAKPVAPPPVPRQKKRTPAEHTAMQASSAKEASAAARAHVAQGLPSARRKPDETHRHAGAEARARRRSSHGSKRSSQQQQRRRQQPAVQRAGVQQSPSSSKILPDLAEVRRAIVFAEILGPPKAFSKWSDPWEGDSP